LETLEARLDGLGEGANSKRLGEAGDTFEQDVAVAEEACEKAVDEALLADDDLADFDEERLDPLARLADFIFYGTLHIDALKYTRILGKRERKNLGKKFRTEAQRNRGSTEEENEYRTTIL